MRNLKNIQQSHVDFKGQPLPLTATAWNTADPSTIAICAFGPTKDDPTIVLKSVRATVDGDGNNALDSGTVITSLNAPCPSPDLESDSILSLQYLAETSSICVILAGGDIVLVRIDVDSGNSPENAIEVVGSVDEGISAAAWAPDGESLAISTRANTLIFMTRDFDSLSTVTLSADDVNASAHVSVGWGKKETQFKGKRAKALQDPTVPEYVDQGHLSQDDDGLTTLSWRGDGAYVVLNSVQDAKTRMLRVFTREGVLDSVSEPVNGLESALSWRPAGNLIAGIQRLQDWVDVVFFERNGLRHGQFTLRLTDHEMQTTARNIHLAWNCDSSILAVAFQDRVQLWAMGNYHYYLKQEIWQFSVQAPTPLTVNWHPETPMALLLSDSSSMQSLAYTFSISNGSTVQPYDAGLIAVVDGRTLKLTPLKLANVPPPMSLFDIELDENAIDVAFNSETSKLAVLTRCTVHLFDIDFSRRKASMTPTPVGSLMLPTSTRHRRQIIFEGQKKEAGRTELVLLAGTATLMFMASDTQSFKGQYTHSSPIVSLCKHTREHATSAFVDNTGQVISIEANDIDQQIRSEQLARLPAACTQVEIWSRPHTEEPKTLVVGLAASTLHVLDVTDTLGQHTGATKISGVTSFVLTPAHLIFTTTQHLLKFVHLNAKELVLPGDEPQKDERCRSIERGAKLVAVMPSEYKLVLQMPRGNLETIHPRALVLANIRDKIKDCEYRQAFLTCRTHRVDMNILHDFAPQKFMDNVGRFVKELDNVTHIDLFLSQLRDEDVAETMYKDTLDMTILDAVDKAGRMQLFNGKVNRICDALLEVFAQQRDKYLQSSVTAHVCKSPPDLEAGLGLVAQLRREHPDLVARAVEHICFLADVNKLYDVSLGLYDLDVALLVAQQSQKDPREYLPHLQRLKELPDGRREFVIDNDLRRYAKALRHLAQLDDFAQVKTYVVKNELYMDALDLYRYQAPRLDEIMRIYADWLSSQSRFADSAIAYESLGDYTSAVSAYRSANMWREALSSAALSSSQNSTLSNVSDISTPNAQHSLATALAESLIESKDFSAAATIYTEHLHDIDSAVQTLGKGYLFADAIRLSALHNRLDLLPVIDGSLADAVGVTTELLSEMQAQLNAQLPRIRELRVKKSTDPLAFFGGGAASGAGAAAETDFPDDISLASTTLTHTTGTTTGTRYTHVTNRTLASNVSRKTSKNRRHEERKRARGKKGSVYEEEYLINSVKRLIERLEVVGGEEVKRLVSALLRRGMRERAIAVESLVGKVWELVEGCLGEVFGEAHTQGQGQGQGIVPDNSSENQDGYGVDGLGEEGASGPRIEMPKIRQRKKFALLGQ